MASGSFNSANFNDVNFRCETGPANPTPPTDNFNFANFHTYNFYYGVPYVNPKYTAYANYSSTNFSWRNFSIESFPFVPNNFEDANFKMIGTDIFVATNPNFTSLCFNQANFPVQTPIARGSLAGNAVVADVVAGKLFYSTDAQTQLVGTLTPTGGATLTVVVNDFPMSYVETGKAKELRSKVG